MNILFVHSHILRRKNKDYYSTGGISANVLHRYLEEKDKLFVYTRCIEYSKEEKLIQVNDDYIECIPSNIYHGPVDYYFNRRALKNEVKEKLKNIDFVIMRIPDLLSEVAYREVRKQRIPYVVEMMGCAWDAMWNYGNIFGKILAPIRFIQVKKIIRNCENVVYVSEKFLQKRYPTKGKSIACSNVNIPLLPDKILNNRIEKIQNLKDTYKIGLIGSLNIDYKGHKTAIKSISKLKDRYKIELHFLGAGEKERWMPLIEKYGVKANVFFDGVLPAGQAVYEWMDQLDLFLIPSLQEGLPRALVEAMSRGCPAVGVKTGGIPELLEEEYVCKKKDYKNIARKIEKILTDKEEMKRQAIRNFKKAKDYNKDKLNNRRKEFFDTIKKDRGL